MKKNLFTFLILILSYSSFSQSLEDINNSQLKDQKIGMIVLGSWAVVNLAVSPVLYSKSEGSTKYFHQMNGMWNVVNLGLAGVSLLTLGNAEVNSYNELLDQQLSLERLLLFNAGLDVGYIMTGFFLRERSKNSEKNQSRLLGYGNSLLLQGGFLLLFDIGFYLFYHTNMSDILSISDKLTLGLNSTGFSIKYKL